MSHRLDKPDERHAKPYAVGTRVYHGGRFTPAILEGTANVVDAVPWSDGEWKYSVQKDDDSFSWWSSYYTRAAQCTHASGEEREK